jgi:murein tripeptide amidase MpaA
MYRTIAQIDSATQLLSQWFPQVFTRLQLPEPSVKGRPVFALRMRAGGGGSRRGVLIVGGTHARELMNPDAIVELAIDLFSSYANGTNLVYGGRTWLADDVKLILEALDIWLVPCMNPDGRDYVMTTDDMWRKNRRDNAGTTCIGTDLNRNSDIVWGVAQGQTSCSPCTDIYCGPSAFSEPETRNIKHLLDTERMVSFVDVHSYSELVLYPWGHAPTQSTDPTKRFTGLASGTCTASIPASYSEYMPPQDVQRFTTVAGRIVADIAAVRGRHYTPETARALYPTTGTQSDYAYSRHIANPALYKTYGFTFETGPFVNNASESFHPADPTLIKRDAKAGLVGLLQQSVCAIELIGIKLFKGETELATLRRVRDDLLATTAAGREWIALFERAQVALLTAVVRDAQLTQEAADVIRATAKAIAAEGAMFAQADATRAARFVQKLKSLTKIRALRADLGAVSALIDKMNGRKMQQLVESLLRKKPALVKESAEPAKAPAAKPTSKRRKSPAS